MSNLEVSNAIDRSSPTRQARLFASFLFKYLDEISLAHSGNGLANHGQSLEQEYRFSEAVIASFNTWCKESKTNVVLWDLDHTLGVDDASGDWILRPSASSLFSFLSSAYPGVTHGILSARPARQIEAILSSGGQTIVKYFDPDYVFTVSGFRIAQGEWGRMAMSCRALGANEEEILEPNFAQKWLSIDRLKVSATNIRLIDDNIAAKYLEGDGLWLNAESFCGVNHSGTSPRSNTFEPTLLRIALAEAAARQDREQSINMLSRLRGMQNELELCDQTMADKGVFGQDLSAINNQFREWVRGLNSDFECTKPWPWIGALLLASNLAEKYDYCIAIAKSGLYSGYAFSTLGALVPVVEAHKRGRSASFKWVTSPLGEELRDKRVLVLEDDIHLGITLACVRDEIAKYSPRTLDLALNMNKRYLRTFGISTGPLMSGFMHCFDPSMFDPSSLSVDAPRFIRALQSK